MPLTTGLVEFWKLDEASGTRNGSLGVFNLADSGATATASFNPEFNTPTQGAACANFAATTVLNVASAAALQISPTVDLTLSAWVNLNTLTNDQFAIVGKSSNFDGSVVEYGLKYANFGFNSGTWQFPVGTAGNAAGQPFPDPEFRQLSFEPVVGKWFHLVGIYKVATQPIIMLYVNNQLFDFVNISASVVTPGTARFSVGANMGAAGTQGKNIDGRVCNVGLWNRALAREEVGNLYNGGNMLTYPLNQLT